MSRSTNGIEPGITTVIHSRFFVVTVYLIFVASAELLTTHNAKYGIVLYAFILFALLTHASLAVTTDSEFAGFLAVLIFAPLIRILSLSLPLSHFYYLTWFTIISIPVYITIFTCLYIQHIKPRDVALALPKLRHLPFEIGIILFAVPFGILEYQVLKPGLLVELRFEALIIPAFIMIICTGFLEELAFRGLMQYHATRAMGFSGIIFVSVLFGFLHIGNLSLLDVVLAGSIGFLYSLVVRRTGSLFGVSVSHGVINITLFLIAPFYF